jgi:bacterioferritin-associated ferredoxin
VSRKVILCRCEDVTLADVQHAVATGYADLEEVKRYTGFGTGPCQGKECLREIALAIADASGRSHGALQPFTTRPPLVPTELKLFAAGRSARDRKG